MKMRYLSIQIKQFLISTGFVLIFCAGISVSNSFNSDYIDQLQNKKSEQKDFASTIKKEETELATDTKNFALEPFLAPTIH